MAVTTTNKTVYESPNKIAVQYTVVGDGAATVTDAVVIDKSGLTGPDKGVEPGSLSLMEIVWNISGSSVIHLEWDHTADDLIGKFAGVGEYTYVPYGGKHDPRSSGGTGDVVFSDNGTAIASGEVVDFYMEFKKKQ